ncbi:MAG: AfsR/SARP family transcriptional regulator, partial [Pikeienuella sp.]
MADVFLKLRSFGVTTLSDSVGNNFVGLGAKALGLLVFVAARAPTAVSREELVELFWERADPAMGRGSLRQALRRIKKTIGAERFAQALEVNDRFVALRPGAVEVDIDLLEALASETDADKLAVLLDYCQGDFLADNAARAVAFQDWAAERRSYYQDLIIGAMSRLGSADLGANKPERARKAAEKIIAIDPLHEQAHEIIIRTLLASGSRGQARNHYERFRREVLTELGAEPGFQLSDLDTPDGPRITVAEAEDSPNKKSQPVIAVM